MAKAAFWQHKEIMRGNIAVETKKRILNCYIFSILNYGCEGWTWSKVTQRNIEAFEMWCYRRMLRLSWKDKVSNMMVLQRVGTERHFLKNMKDRKLQYAGHVLRGSGGDAHLYILEGKVEGKRPRGRPKATWLDDIIAWTGLGNYGMIKRMAEKRCEWKTMIVNLLAEDDN